MDFDDIPKFKYIEVAQVGSNVICNPPPGRKSDYDYLFLVSNLEEERKHLEAEDWETGGSTDELSNSDWASLKKDNKELKCKENFILTDNAILFDNFVKAVRLCKRLNLLDKEDRITVHKAIIYDEWPVESGRM